MKTTRGFVEDRRTDCDALKRVGPAGLRILDRLVDVYGTTETDKAWLHAYAIHKEAGVTYPAVWVFLAGLEKAGLVDTRRATVSGRTRKLYRLNEKGYRSAVDVFRRKAMVVPGSPGINKQGGSGGKSEVPHAV